MSVRLRSSGWIYSYRSTSKEGDVCFEQATSSQDPQGRHTKPPHSALPVAHVLPLVLRQAPCRLQAGKWTTRKRHEMCKMFWEPPPFEELVKCFQHIGVILRYRKWVKSLARWLIWVWFCSVRVWFLKLDTIADSCDPSGHFDLKQCPTLERFLRMLCMGWAVVVCNIDMWK